MKEKIISTIINYLLTFLQVQLVISLVLLIILPCWGFAISMLSPLGNIIFTPFFTVFLLLSSLLFFAEILCIPNGLFIYLLEKVTNLWLYLIPDFNNMFLIGFTKPPILFIIAIPLLTLIILLRIHTIKKNILALSLLFILSSSYLKFINGPSQIIKNIACNGGQITVIHDNGKTAVIDPGYIGRRISAPSWVEYTLVPEILKSCGNNCIEHLIVMQPGKMTFDAMQKLLTIIPITNIYLVCFFGQMKKNSARSFFALKNEAEKRNITIHRIGFSSSTINLSKNIHITIEPLEEKLSYNETTYPALCATYNIGSEIIKFYSAKYKKGAQARPHNIPLS